MGGSVIWLDIPRDTVLIDCNVKSTRGHTSIHLTPWEGRAQYKRWNQETYKPHDKASHLMDRFHAAERRARSIWQSRCLSLHRVALGMSSQITEPPIGLLTHLQSNS